MKKLNVNKEACIGCGACVSIDGEHFDFDENGYSEVISNENIDGDATRNAIDSCPTSAISYIEEVNNNAENSSSEVINNDNVNGDETGDTIDSCPTSNVEEDNTTNDEHDCEHCDHNCHCSEEEE